MKPEEQRIAIAEACGWKNVDAGAGRVWGFTTRHKGTPSESDVCVDIPNYLKDLNAMHDVEKTMNNNDWWKFVEHLTNICGGGTALGISATASQRAEAFLRTIGKWKECK